MSSFRIRSPSGGPEQALGLAIVHRAWLVRDDRMLQLRWENGRRCRLAQKLDGSWTPAPMACGRQPSEPALVREAGRRMVGPVTSGTRFAQG
jgi:hypothetical protein